MSDTSPVRNEKHLVDGSPARSVDSAERQQSGRSHNGFMSAVARQFVAKEPMREAPLVFGGHRQAVEPEKLGPGKAFLKFLTFVGPGVILSLSINDPDNFQQDIESGQDSGYTQICPLWIAVSVAIYFQVSTPRRPVTMMIPGSANTTSHSGLLSSLRL